ncbi:Diphthamide biosynthesis protein 4 [Colletotrichum chlorophyti]|uniref:Diphthamide biosynthesis protein 4 n=1 Tax=Colletotrichum chlorophyti TaxID=708187 RepID=A0A1Q8RVE6_9PEZI|nr:Diphthamide biosynthesis protein 4 [Colletotrichum chlorophyti]
MTSSPVTSGEVPPLGHTYYTVLGISRGLLQDQAAEPQQVIKRAYHRALLQNHPDKFQQIKSQDTITTTSSMPIPLHKSHYPSTNSLTIDHISTAYKVLSDPKSRAEYDKSLELTPNNQGSKLGEQGFQTGIENVDLDDLDFDNGAECWYRGCRCGNSRGFLFTETDLEEAGENGELLVGCQDCSLWMKVHFAIVSD